MPTFIALLRAVNVGGTGKLPMSDLKRLGEDAGFSAVRTYIASGNVVFESEQVEAEVRAALEDALQAYAGRSIGVLVRTAAEMAAVLADNPFPEAVPSRTMAVFLDGPPAAEAVAEITGRQDEELRLGRREIYVLYGEGMGRSKLRIAAASNGTARNMNTVAALARMAAD